MLFSSPKTAREGAKRTLLSTALPPATTATSPSSAFGDISNDVQEQRPKPPPSRVKSLSRAPPGTQPSSSRPEQRGSAFSLSSSSSSRKAISHSPPKKTKGSLWPAVPAQVQRFHDSGEPPKPTPSGVNCTFNNQ
ncbi:hypothetical protein FRC00_010897, partial [Tulasnella sp. 408]